MLFGTIESGSIAKIEVSSVAFSKKRIELAVDEIVYITTSILPKESQHMANLTWEYDKSILYVESADNTGMTIKGLAAGQTSLKIKAGDYSDTCVITVTGEKDLTTEAPYIYSTFTFCEIPIGTQTKINVSLYNGTIGDVNDFTWSIEDPTVASISASGQYCIINAQAEGFTRIKVSHPKATYQYYINVLSYGDNTKTPYIFTDEDVITMNLSSGIKTVNISLKNAPTTASNADFKWEVINAEAVNPFSISANGKTCNITPSQSGSAYIQVSHPLCVYPLTILIRVVSIVKNVYIEPSATQLTITGEQTKSITAQLKGSTDILDIDQYVWTVEDETIIDYYANADQISLTPIRNGSTYITISHPAAEFSRRVLVICKGLLSDALDASCFITTSQNYVRTKVGGSTTVLNISLKGGASGDEKDFVWNIKSTAKDGSDDNVIDFFTENGTVAFSRKAIASSAYGKGTITPLKPGTAVITLQHPSSYYSTEVLVVVLDEKAIVNEPFMLSTGMPLVSLVTGEERTLSTSLIGNNILPSDENNIVWSSTCPALTITPNGLTANIKATSSEYSSAIVKATHPNAIESLSFVALIAQTPEELELKKALYSYVSDYRLAINNTINLSIYGHNFTETDYDNITWSASNSNCTVSADGMVQGVTVGTSVITAQCPGAVPYTFTITVLPENIPVGYLGAPIYLTTTQNVNILNIGSSITINTTLLNAPTEEYQNISWQVDNPSIISINPSGNTASITGLSDGECKITVTHPKSGNILKIDCKVGSEYIFIPTPDDVYVSVNQDVISLVKNAQSFLLQSFLVNNDSLSGFTFTNNQPTIASLTTFDDGRCFIKPIEAGQCVITVSHASTPYSKDVLVLVANTEEELHGFSYLKTAQRMLTLGTGKNKAISVSVANAETPIEGYVWSSSNRAIVDVASSGSTAVLYANTEGTVKITVSHSSITYPLEIICVVVDSSLMAKTPYISVNPKLLTITKSTSWSSINAELVGSENEAELSNFTWSCADSSIAQLVSEGSVAKVRGIGVGITTATVMHPNAKYPEQITIVVDNYKDTDCVIDIKESIIDMKPTDGAKTITANLVNGNAEDKYTFKWSLDVYDVVDLKFSNNVASITPLNQGECTINISHPKAAFNQQIIVRVSEFKNFGFGVTNKTVSEGKTAFIAMQVPASSVSQHIVYISDNANVCSIMGTNQVCQITGIGAGTTKVKAQLIATATNTIKAESELLVSVEENNNLLVYITAPQNIYTIEKGGNRTLSATLTGQGVVPTDQNNLQWKSSNPNIVKVRGASTTGIVSSSSVYIEAVEAGEATITVSHEKSNSDYTFMIIVPGSKDKTIVLNKTYVNLMKGNSTEVTAKISNALVTDYQTITWEIGKFEGQEICRLMGSGQTVGLFAIAPGNVMLSASLPNGNRAVCEVNIEASRLFMFEFDSLGFYPGQTKQVKFDVAPNDADIRFSTDKDGIISYRISAAGILEITALQEGQVTLTGLTQYNNKDSLYINSAWNYGLILSGNKVSGKPTGSHTLEYTVHPPDAIISLKSANNSLMYSYSVNSTTKTITIVPSGEVIDTLIVSAKNPANNTTFLSKEIAIDFRYASLTPAVQLSSKNGNFSYVSNNTVHIGDGETVTLKAFFTEPNSTYTITNFQVRNVNSVPSLSHSAVSTGTKEGVVSIDSSSRNVVQREYLIPTWYNCYTPVLYKNINGTYTKAYDTFIVENWMTFFFDDHPWAGGISTGWAIKYENPFRSGDLYFVNEYGSWAVFRNIITQSQAGGSWQGVVWPWRVINPGLSNTRISKIQYERNPIWYNPTTYTGGTSSKPGTRTGGQTGNQPAILVADDDQSLISTSQDYELIITYNHFGTSKTVTIPVFIDIRYCNKLATQSLSD